MWQERIDKVQSRHVDPIIIDQVQSRHASLNL